MKTLVVVAVLGVLACAKQTSAEAGSGSGSSAAAQPVGGGSAGSAAGATKPAPPASRSPSARALEDFDRAFAPIFKLPGGARLRALCTRRRVLDAKSVALVEAAPAGSSSWKEDAQAVVELIGSIAQACGQIPKKALASDQSLADNDLGGAGDMVPPLHEALAALIKDIPDARPIDTHAGDPLPPADPPDAAVNLGHLRAALHALDDAAVKLAASAKHAKSRAEACKGADRLAGLANALNADDIIAGPPNADDWSGHLGNLAMVISNLTDIKCGDSSTKSASDIAASFENLHERVGELVAMCK